MIYDIWEDWMGYAVYYVQNDTIQAYSKNVPLDFAQERLIELLKRRKCAWIEKTDPTSMGDIPF